jgi:hypothetical protein
MRSGTAQAVRRFLTAQPKVLAQVRPCGVRCGQSATVPGLSPIPSVLAVSAITPQLHTDLQRGPSQMFPVYRIHFPKVSHNPASLYRTPEISKSGP